MPTDVRLQLDLFSLQLMYSCPVVVFVFKRIANLSDIFISLKRAGVETGLVFCDAPSSSEDGHAVAEVQQFLKTAVKDMPGFKIITSPTHRAIASQFQWGLQEAFRLFDRAIILEDDCVPHPQFFKFCNTMLHKYENDTQVASISGFNMLGSVDLGYDAFFSRFSLMNWGWATWRRSWQQYDISMNGFEEDIDRLLQDYVSQPQNRLYLRQAFAEVKRKQTTWDVQWNYMMWKQNSYCVVPRGSLISNRGFGEGASYMRLQDREHVYEETFPWQFKGHLPNIKRTPFDSLLEEHLVALIKAVEAANR